MSCGINLHKYSQIDYNILVHLLSLSPSFARSNEYWEAKVNETCALAYTCGPDSLRRTRTSKCAVVQSAVTTIIWISFVCIRFVFPFRTSHAVIIELLFQTQQLPNRTKLHCVTANECAWFILGGMHCTLSSWVKLASVMN